MGSWTVFVYGLKDVVFCVWTSRQCMRIGRYDESQTARIEIMDLHPKEWQDSLQRPKKAC